VRIPDNEIARRIAEELGNPILSTSLPTDNLTYDEITLPEEISLRADNMQVDMMIDGGNGGDQPSTVVDLTDSHSPEIIREGVGVFDF
jgi:tRNA A37 threonylcarbamoyladenosine synthetase subunit TsaC/SUA5/YrdC